MSTETGKQAGAGPATAEHTHRYTAALAREIEARWQAEWERRGTFRTPNPGAPGFDAGRPKFYVLDMFPYPSGIGLHVGHPLGYIATDVLARFHRMRGFNVLHPMGFDAFGLPAEQFAVEHGVHPQVTTESNIATMLRQLKALGLSYDWDRSLSTTDVDYYRWTQWIFLQLYHSHFDEAARAARPIGDLVARLESGELAVCADATIVDAGEAAPDARPWSALSQHERSEALAGRRLAYLAEIPVNWCPALGTVLANEEVTNEGRSERGNHPVFKRPLRQWMLRITAYAERLLEDLELVDWPEPIKLMQRNWIGPSSGAEIAFAIDGSEERIAVFTTRPDTIFGATYMVLAPEHALVESITTAAQRDAVQDYRRQAERRSEIDRMAETREKTGVFTGTYAVNPANGEQIPIWIADYVLMGYGTGAIMAVPGQDDRDWAFAERFGLSIVRTVQPPEGFDDGAPYLGDGPAINSGFLDGLQVEPAKKRIIEWLETEGIGCGAVSYKLRDWLFSRQRYWGEPFPVLHGPGGEIVAIDASDLPVELPPMEDFSPEISDDPDAPPRPPLSRAPASWRIVERDGVRYERELNTMPQWAGSCWYYLRFIDPRCGDRFVSAESEAYWMGERGIDLYVGGAEHAVLHLLYARFWHKVLFDLGQVSTLEPFGRLYNQGYIQAYAYRDERGIVVDPGEIVDQEGRAAAEVQDQPDRRFTGPTGPVTQEYGKMGKSLKNAVSPDDICAQFGCDTLRLYEMYMGPLDQSKPWNPRDITGLYRFIQRLWRLAVDERTGELSLRAEPDPEVERRLDRTVARVEHDIERMSFNTAIAALIELVNAATASGGLSVSQLERLALIVSPFAPHLSEELWTRLGRNDSISGAPWPAYDADSLREDRVEIPVQVKGKVRGRVTVDAGASEDQIKEAALADERVVAALAGRPVRKVIVVQGKIVNIVV